MEIIYVLVGTATGILIYKYLVVKNLISYQDVENKYVSKELYLQQEQLIVEKDQQLQHLNIELGKMSVTKKEVDDLQKTFTTNFENIANKLLETKSEVFTKQNQKNIEALLNPFKENIQELKIRIENTHKSDYAQRETLKEQIINLMDLSKEMKGEAENLTQALQGKKQLQGQWGEELLERILEVSGLMRDVHYFTQETIKDDEGKNKRPDIIIRMPEDKILVIDSKVSLNAYVNYTARMNEGNQKEAEQYIKEHIQNIKTHINGLSEKRYQDLYENTPDFVFMFFALESAYLEAINNDPSLQSYAMERKIVLVSTTTLFATMRTVATFWKNEDQKRNAIEIATEGGKLYDKFVGFYQNLLEVGKKMDDAKSNYTDAMRKLSEGPGNLVSKAEKMKKLGAKAGKQIDNRILKRANNL